MNMQKVNVNQHGFACICCKCGYVIGRLGKENEPRFADLEGKPWEAYYCEACANGALLNQKPERID